MGLRLQDWLKNTIAASATGHPAKSKGFIEDCIGNVRADAQEAQRWSGPRFGVGKWDLASSLRSPAGTALMHRALLTFLRGEWKVGKPGATPVVVKPLLRPRKAGVLPIELSCVR